MHDSSSHKRLSATEADLGLRLKVKSVSKTAGAINVTGAAPGAAPGAGSSAGPERASSRVAERADMKARTNCRFNRGRVHLVAALAAAALVASASSAGAATTYWSRAELLKSFFADCQRVTYKRLHLDPAQQAAVAKRLGRPATADWTVYYGLKDGAVQGVAVIDHERGQHLPITFGVLIGTDGTVRRVEVMVYREAHGDAIREKRFRKQFRGKRAVDPVRHGEDIVAISGATISSRSMALGVRRVLIGIDEAVIRPGIARTLRTDEVAGR